MPGRRRPLAGSRLPGPARDAGQPHCRAAPGHRLSRVGNEPADRVWHRQPTGGEALSTYPDHILRVGSQHLAELKRKAAEFERQLWDAHESLEHEMAQSSFTPEDVTLARQEAFRWIPGTPVPYDADDARTALQADPVPVPAPA